MSNLNAALLYPRNTPTRFAQSLDGMWRFSLDEKGVGRSAHWENGLPMYVSIPVPGSFQDLFTDKKYRDFVGDVWYETDVFVPADWKEKQVDIRFGSATHQAIVYLNGNEVARHEGGFTPFCADISSAKFGEYNRLSVCVNNELSETTLPVGITVNLYGHKCVLPYFDFFNYAGLQRSVWLVCTPQKAITDLSVAHELTADGAAVNYCVRTTTDDVDVEVTVLDETGSEVARTSGTDGRIEIPHAHLWQVRNAYLYRFVVRCLKDGALLDEWYDDIGIRTVRVCGCNILVNDKPVYLKGCGKHEDCDVAGRTVSLPLMKRDFELLKRLGANSVRTTHYPHSEEFYQMADREGILVIDEVAAVGCKASTMNFLGGSQEKIGFFEKKTTPILLEKHLAAVRELIDRDKNHACVIGWCLFNEPQTTHESAVPYFEKVFEEALNADPQKRPRTFTMERSSDYGTCKCYQLSDFVSLNRYYGWYIPGGGALDVAEMQLRQELDGWKKSGLTKPLVFTEYGADTDAKLHKVPSVMWSQEYQEEMLAMNHRVFDDYDFVAGEQVWSFSDFQTTENIMRVDGNKKGIFTRERQPKAAAFTLKKRWESLPLDHHGNSLPDNIKSV